MRNTKTLHRYPVTGIIIANEWDMDGNVTDVVIYADNEEIYLVSKKESVDCLLNAIQQKVKIFGEIIELSNNRKRINIEIFQVIKSIDNHINKS